MRQPDWRTWLLEEPERQVAQELFLLHPEWEPFAERSETGGLALHFPSSHRDGCGLALECSVGVIAVEWAEWRGVMANQEAHEAMRLIEAILEDRVVVDSEWKEEEMVSSRLTLLSGRPVFDREHRIEQSPLLAARPITRTSRRSWSGALDQVDWRAS